MWILCRKLRRLPTRTLLEETSAALSTASGAKRPRTEASIDDDDFDLEDDVEGDGDDVTNDDTTEPPPLSIDSVEEILLNLA